MKNLFLLVFFIVTAIHLYASLLSNKKLRNITKPFILISLLVYYCLATSQIRLVTILALLFSWLGDVLLIGPGVKWFTYGGISFMVSHFFFVLSYLTGVNFNSFSYLYVIVIALFFITTVTIIFTRLKKYLPSKLFYPMYLYLLINGTMNSFALFRLLSDCTRSNIITCIGAILFFISDSALFFVRFKKDSIQKNHFIVMLTYSIGEFLIVLGLI